MKVSAIISAYYCADYLEERIENLKTQTRTPEIVVVAQHGSLEAEIADQMLELLDIIVPTEDIPTIYEAWNLGIRASSGDYLTNANADDRLAPHALEALAAVLDADPDAAMAYADVDIVESLDGGFDHAWRTGYFRWLAPAPHEQHQALLQTCYLGPQPMWRRSLHEKYGYFDPEFKSAGDYEFWLRLAKGGEHFLKLNEVLGIYLSRPDQAEQRFNQDGTAQRETLLARERYAV